MPSKFTGGKSAKRLVKNIPEAMRAELVTALEQGGNELLAAMKARAPHRTGTTQGALEKKVYPKTLRLRVGLFKATRKRLGLFYSHIIEFGRRAQTVIVRRRVAGSGFYSKTHVNRSGRAGVNVSGAVISYPLTVKPLSGRRFVTGPLGGPRAVFRRKLKGVWDRVLKAAAEGAGND